MIDIQIESVEGGTKISVVKDGVVTSSGIVKDGTTPDFKVENGNLYVSYDEETE